MNCVTNKDAIETITTHYIDGAFVESHGREVMDIITPTWRSARSHDSDELLKPRSRRLLSAS